MELATPCPSKRKFVGNIQLRMTVVVLYMGAWRNRVSEPVECNVG